MSYNQLRLVDGTIVRRCPTDKPLYCSREGKFYSVHNAVLTDDGWMMQEVKYYLSPKCRGTWRSSNGIYGSHYPHMRKYGNTLCHKLIALTWIGPRPKGMEIDHLNGDKFNCSADNLQYVTPAENRRRAKLLRELRSIGRDPSKMSREELLSIFSHYDFQKPDTLMHYQMSHHMQ